MNGDLFAGLSLLLDSRPSPKTTGLVRSVFLSPDQLVSAARLITWKTSAVWTRSKGSW